MTDLIQRNFAAGELSPALYSRADQVKYQTGLRTCLNFYVRKSGGVSNRAGLKFVGEANTNLVLNEQKVYRLTKFVFNDDQTYIIEIGPRYFRFIKNGAYIPIPVAVANWISGFTYTAGDFAAAGGIKYVAIVTNLNVGPAGNTAYWEPFAPSETLLRIPTSYAWLDLNLLKFQQSADVIIITHPNYPTKKLVRRADDKWYIENFTTGSWGTPVPVITCTGTLGSAVVHTYTATAVNAQGEETAFGEEENIALANAVSETYPVFISVNNNPLGSVEFNFYRKLGGRYGYIGTAPFPGSFRDVFATPDMTSGPPLVPLHSFVTVGNYPAISAFVQQRLAFAGSDLEPETVRMSRTGEFNNFAISQPVQDNDSITFTLAGKKVAEVRAIIELGSPIIFTASGEWILNGDQDGAIMPTAINAVQKAYNGINKYIDPVIVDNTIIYLQARGSIIRDFKYDIEGDGYQGKDLTVFSDHLFKDTTLLAMDYQQNPDSIMWCVRDDGTLLGLSYLREHSIWGWHRHTTDGRFVDVCVVPEGGEDALYVIVERKVQDALRYYVERLVRRMDEEPSEMFFVDSGLTYDGTNTNGNIFMRINSTTAFTVDDELTLFCNTPYFVSGDVGNAIVMRREETEQNLNVFGRLFTERTDEVTLDIITFTDSQNVVVRPTKDVPVWFIGNLINTWAKAVDMLSGLGHIEGKTVAIVSDGNVVSDGYEDPAYVVTVGSVTIPRPGVVIHVGLPYTSDLESLDLEAKDMATTIRPKTKLVTHVGVILKHTPSLKAGIEFDKLTEIKIRELEDMGEPTVAKTGFIDVSVEGTWEDEPRVCVRQDQPLPATVTAFVPRTLVGG